jgi:hypothetical protein
MYRKILLFLILFLVILFVWFNCDKKNPAAPTNPLDMPYNVVIDSVDFENVNITGNTFFPLKPSTTFVYEGEDEDGITIRVEDKVTDQTKVILDVTCVVVENKEWEDGELVEETLDWYAQDKQGNVWYFGEDSKEIEDGIVVSTEGSWEAGVDGALPGILMLANPIVGMWYRQEYYEGEAEDVAQVLSLQATVTVPYGTYNNCLQTAEWNPLEPEILEHKFYAADVGFLRAIAVKGESDYEDLINIVVN